MLHDEAKGVHRDNQQLLQEIKQLQIIPENSTKEREFLARFDQLEELIQEKQQQILSLEKCLEEKGKQHSEQLIASEKKESQYKEQITTIQQSVTQKKLKIEQLNKQNLTIYKEKEQQQLIYLTELKKEKEKKELQGKKTEEVIVYLKSAREENRALNKTYNEELLTLKEENKALHTQNIKQVEAVKTVEKEKELQSKKTEEIVAQLNSVREEYTTLNKAHDEKLLLLQGENKALHTQNIKQVEAVKTVEKEKELQSKKTEEIVAQLNSVREEYTTLNKAHDEKLLLLQGENKTLHTQNIKQVEAVKTVEKEKIERDADLLHLRKKVQQLEEACLNLREEENTFKKESKALLQERINQLNTLRCLAFQKTLVKDVKKLDASKPSTEVEDKSEWEVMFQGKEREHRQLKGLHNQLRHQFEVKSDVLHKTRSELFSLEGKLEAISREEELEKDELNCSVNHLMKIISSESRDKELLQNELRALENLVETLVA